MRSEAATEPGIEHVANVETLVTHIVLVEQPRLALCGYTFDWWDPGLGSLEGARANSPGTMCPDCESVDSLLGDWPDVGGSTRSS